MRVLWLDILKGYAMLMVIYAHVENRSVGMMSFFAPVFLTAFFFSSGYTFNPKKSFPKFLCGKVYGLLIPWFLLAALNIVATHLITFNEPIPLKQQFIELLLQNGTSGNRLWFIAAIFEIYIIFYWVVKSFKFDKPYFFIGLIMVLLLSSFAFEKFGITDLYWHIQSLGAGCFWVGVGYLARQYDWCNKLFVFLSRRSIKIAIVAVYLAVVAGEAYFLDNTYIAFSNFGISLGLYFLTSFLGLVSLLLLSKWREELPGKFWILFVGRNTLLYFALHGKVLSLLHMVLGKVGFFQPFLSESQVIVPGLIVMVCSILLVVPVYLIDKYFPVLSGKGFKKSITPRK